MKKEFIQKLKIFPITHKATANALAYFFAALILAILFIILTFLGFDISTKYIPLVMLFLFALEFAILALWIKIAENYKGKGIK